MAVCTTAGGTGMKRRHQVVLGLLAAIHSSLLVAAPGDLSLVTPSPSSPTATESSIDATFSADGRFVIYRSSAPNLVETDKNLHEDIFIFDRTTNTNSRIANVRQCTGPDTLPTYGITGVAISGNGRFVAWGVDEFCTLEGDFTTTSLVLFDRDAKTRTKIAGEFDERFGSIQFSADSKSLVFEAKASGSPEIWVYDIPSKQSTQVGKGASFGSSPSISADGSIIAFASDAIGINDTNDVADIFVYRRATGQTELVSKSTAGAIGNAPSGESYVSGDGRYVAYSSDASNLVAGDTNQATDIFMFELATGKTTRASRTLANTQLDGPSVHPGLS